MILFFNFKQKAEIFFLDNSSAAVDIGRDKKYHIILSPALYWIKKEKLPLKYLHEVKKIAPTLFEDILPKGEYSYFAYKEEDNFILFAYEDKEILALLEKKGISLTNIASISFSQTALDTSVEALKIDDERVLTKKEGMVVVLPALWFLDAQALQKHHFTPSKHTIKLEQFSHIIDTKTVYKLGVFLGAFIVILAVEYFTYYGVLQKLSQQKEQLFKQHKLKPTLMQNSAILTHYKSVAVRQEKLREYISYILKAQLMKNEKITEIAYENKKLHIVLQGVQKDALQRIFTDFYKKKIALDIQEKANQLIVEVAL